MKKKVLYVNASPNPTMVGAAETYADAFLDELKQLNENLNISTINLYDHPWSKHLRHDEFANETFYETVDHFLSFDRIVFAFGMYNLSVPSILKSYIDRIVIREKTFGYTKEGLPKGLLANKNVKSVLFAARGGFYIGKNVHHDVNFMADNLNFMGINDVKTFLMEGTQIIDENKNFKFHIEDEIKKQQTKLKEAAIWFLNK